MGGSESSVRILTSLKFGDYTMKKLLLTGYFITIFVSFGCGCPPGWGYYDGTDSCILSSETTQDYTQSLELCRSMNAEIATVTDIYEQIFYKEYLYSIRNDEFHFIGSSNASPYWIDGTLITKQEYLTAPGHAIVFSRFEAKQVEMTARNKALCKMPEVYCPPPPVYPTAILHGTGNASYSIRTFSCLDGLDFYDGSFAIHCQLDKTWNDTGLQCKNITSPEAFASCANGKVMFRTFHRQNEAVYSIVRVEGAGNDENCVTRSVEYTSQQFVLDITPPACGINVGSSGQVTATFRVSISEQIEQKKDFLSRVSCNISDSGPTKGYTTYFLLDGAGWVQSSIAVRNRLPTARFVPETDYWMLGDLVPLCIAVDYDPKSVFIGFLVHGCSVDNPRGNPIEFVDYSGCTIPKVAHGMPEGGFTYTAEGVTGTSCMNFRVFRIYGYRTITVRCNIEFTLTPRNQNATVSCVDRRRRSAPSHGPFYKQVAMDRIIVDPAEYHKAVLKIANIPPSSTSIDETITPTIVAAILAVGVAIRAIAI